MIDIELPACFYLGRECDLGETASLAPPVMYEARDLTTHGVVVGMTGSGKTGLCITILEEAAIDGIPSIIIDLKGDLSNLLLNFPELQPEQFTPWLNSDDARRKKRSLAEHAAAVAESWRDGLVHSGQGPERIARLRKSSEWRIYTPGSEAGLPVSILGQFNAPRGQISRESLHEKVEATATGLLGLTRTASDPVQSREHILIANLLLNAWLHGRDMNLEKIIQEIQAPPLSKIGAFDVDTFYPEKERMKLAVALNNILASPSFSTWITGEPLKLDAMLHAADGRPRQLIFYLAHLDDTQRMFFLTLLLEEVLAWTRAQQGTTSLRALLYFDEVFGYLPPHPANPPTKQPLMTLMKQARAFGVGVLLATQNPVDIDYKALTNAGTWFIGKLQTERDKARLLDGLESVAAAQGTLTDRKHLDQVISSLGKRVFLLHSVHAGKPRLFQTRWTLSYLSGPLTRDQIEVLMRPVKEELAARERPSAKPTPDWGASPQADHRACPQCGAAAPPTGKFCPECGGRLPVRVETAAEDQFKSELLPPVPPAEQPATTAQPGAVPPELAQYYLAAAPLAAPLGATPSADLHYHPRLLGVAEVLFADPRKGIEHWQTYRLLTDPPAGDRPPTWHGAESIGEVLGSSPEVACVVWASVPEAMQDGRRIRSLERSFIDHLYGNAVLVLMHNRHFELFSDPAEDVQGFLQRCREAARQASEVEVADLRNKFLKKLDSAGASLQAAQADLDASRSVQHQTLRNGSSLLSMLWSWGRSTSRPTAAASRVAAKVARDIERAQTEVQKKQAQQQRLQEEWEDSVQRIGEKWLAKAEDIKEVRLTPRKTDVRLTHFGLAWTPYWQIKLEGQPPRMIPAYLRS